MKKKAKKLAALMLAAVMTLAMGTVVFADEDAPTSATPSFSTSDTGSITVNGLEAGVTVNAYQIAKATYDSGNFTGYAMVNAAKECTFQIESDGSYAEGTLTEANLAELFSVVGGGEATYTATVSESNTSATITGLPVGSYLLVVTGSESVTYGMMIGSVSYDVGTEGNWIISDGTVSVSGSESWAKATTPGITKTEKTSENKDTHGDSANVGDEVTFDITVSNIPSYQGEYPLFDVIDTLTGLTMSADEVNGITVKVMNGENIVATLEKDTDYTVEWNNDTNSFDVNFVVSKKYTLNNYAGQGYTLVIEYKATVAADNSTKAADAHTNEAVLHYSTNSYVENGNVNTKDTDYEYTFAFTAYKTNGNMTGENYDALAGATFGLFTDASCGNNYAYTQNGSTVTTTSGSNGYFTFSGLKAGTYYMKETKAPAGYQLNQTVYTVNITASYNESNGQISTWSITVTDDGLSEGGITVASDGTQDTSTLTIINTKTGLLPSMGGRGTLTVTLIGCAVVCAAAAGVAVSRKRKAA